MFCFNDFFVEFNKQKQILAFALDRIQDDVKAAERNAEEIEKDVSKWLEDANNEIEAVNCLENEREKHGKFFTWCPNWIQKFKLSKALAKKTVTLRNLEENTKKSFQQSPQSSSSRHRISSIKGIYALKIITRSFCNNGIEIGLTL
jgi:hypothetical protein